MYKKQKQEKGIPFDFYFENLYSEPLCLSAGKILITLLCLLVSYNRFCWRQGLCGGMVSKVWPGGHLWPQERFRFVKQNRKELIIQKKKRFFCQ